MFAKRSVEERMLVAWVAWGRSEAGVVAMRAVGSTAGQRSNLVHLLGAEGHPALISTVKSVHFLPTLKSVPSEPSGARHGFPQTQGGLCADQHPDDGAEGGSPLGEPLGGVSACGGRADAAVSKSQAKSEVEKEELLETTGAAIRKLLRYAPPSSCANPCVI